MANQITLDPNTPLTLTLPASAVQVIIAALDEIPRKFSQSIVMSIVSQVEAATTAAEDEPIPMKTPTEA